MKRISTHTQTLNAIKAAIIRDEDVMFMLFHYLENPYDALRTLRRYGRPVHFYKNNAEGCTIKMHNIL